MRMIVCFAEVALGALVADDAVNLDEYILAQRIGPQRRKIDLGDAVAVQVDAATVFYRLFPDVEQGVAVRIARASGLNDEHTLARRFAEIAN